MAHLSTVEALACESSLALALARTAAFPLLLVLLASLPLALEPSTLDHRPLFVGIAVNSCCRGCQARVIRSTAAIALCAPWIHMLCCCGCCIVIQLERGLAAR